MISKYPDYTDFVWVKRSSKPTEWELAYFVSPLPEQMFQNPYTVGDGEGLSVEYYEDVIDWLPLETPKADLEAIAVLRQLAQEYCVVELTISDCGCHRAELWLGSEKIAEEDKDLGVCVENLRKRIEEKE